MSARGLLVFGVCLFLALRAQAEDLGGVVGQAVTVLDCLLCSPLLDGTTVDFRGLAAVGADHVVVMVAASAVAVQGFASVHVQHVDGVDFCEGLQGAVHGGQANAFAADDQLIVDVAGRVEVFEISKDRDHSCTLAGAAGAQLRHGRVLLVLAYVFDSAGLCHSFLHVEKCEMCEPNTTQNRHSTSQSIGVARPIVSAFFGSCLFGDHFDTKRV